MKKYLLSLLISVVTAIVASIPAQLIYYSAHMEKWIDQFPTIMKASPDYRIFILALLCFNITMILILDKMNIKGLKDGAINGAWINALFFMFINLQFFALMDGFITLDYLIVDFIGSSIIGGFIGASIGWSLEKFE